MRNKKLSAPLLWKLYAAFFRIGLFTFGGGYSMLPMLEREVVDKYGWASQEKLLDYFAVGQCTPGIIAVNTATFVGYKQQGVVGGILASLGVVSPSLIIITLVAAVLEQFSTYPVVQHAFAGIRVAVTALILASVIKLWKKNVKDVLSVALCVLAFAMVAVLGASPIFVVLGAALVGIIVGRIKRAGKAAEND